MNLTKFKEYIKAHATWYNKPDKRTPVDAAALMQIETGIKSNNEAIQELAAAVVSQIVNDPNKIASMAALFAVNEKVTELNRDIMTGNFITLQTGATYRKVKGLVQLILNSSESIVIPENGSIVLSSVLPVGFRPDSGIMFPITYGPYNKFCGYGLINADGTIKLAGSAAGAYPCGNVIFYSV